MTVLTDHDVQHALENGEFIPHFQPLVHLRTGQLMGFELLARWCHPQIGWISPEKFIPLAERDGWIHRLTRELLQKGLEAVAALPYTLSVNISPIQLYESALIEQIRASSASTGFPLNRLILEITESALTEDLLSARRIIQGLKQAGCRLALDDFGTGYSSLRHLQSLPFDEIKVDQSFVHSMTQKRDSRKIVATVVGLGQSLDLTTVAEGVETEEEAEMLLWLGCELGQGWLFGKPIPATELNNLGSQLGPTHPSCVTGRRSLGSLESFPAQRLANLQAVYDGAPVGLAFIDCNQRYMNLNRRLAAMNGFPMEEHLGRTVAEMIPGIYPAVEPFIRRALQGEAIPGVEIVKPIAGSDEPKTILLSYEPAFDEAGEVVGVSVAIADMTETRRAEKARRESEEHFHSMIELIPQIPWVLDAEGRALDVSLRWLELTGMTGDQWRGFGWLSALHPDDVEPTLEAMRKAIRTGNLMEAFYRVRQSPDHSWQWLHARGSSRRGPDGAIVNWYGVLEPIEEADVPLR